MIVVTPDGGGAGFGGGGEAVVDVGADEAGGAVVFGEPSGECGGFVAGGFCDVGSGFGGVRGQVVGFEKDHEFIGGDEVARAAQDGRAVGVVGGFDNAHGGRDGGLAVWGRRGGADR